LPRHLALKRFTVKLPVLLNLCAPGSERAVVVDVGAAVHGLSPPWDMQATSIHEDDSDALWLLGGLGEIANVHAFEANPERAEHLRRAAKMRQYTARASSALKVHQVGVGATPGVAFVMGCNTANTWAVSGTNGVGSECRRRARRAAINLTSIDTFAATLSSPLFYVKIDVEGAEWDVLRGMHRILRRGDVQLLSFEYGKEWHPLFEKNGPLSAAEMAIAHNRSLGRFQRKLDRFGYDVYLMGLDSRSDGVALVPVSGKFWDEVRGLGRAFATVSEGTFARVDCSAHVCTYARVQSFLCVQALEICANRARFYGTYAQWCWNDLLVVRRCNSCVRRAIWHNLIPATQHQPKTWTPRGHRAFFGQQGHSGRVTFPSCHCS
jgi:FkbM family methyltransferase